MKKITLEIVDRGGKGKAYGDLGIAYQSLVDYRKSIGCHENRLKIAIQIDDRPGEGEPMEVSAIFTSHLLTLVVLQKFLDFSPVLVWSNRS